MLSTEAVHAVQLDVGSDGVSSAEEVPGVSNRSVNPLCPAGKAGIAPSVCPDASQ